MTKTVTRHSQNLRLLIHTGPTTAVTQHLPPSLTKSRLTRANIQRLSKKLLSNILSFAKKFTATEKTRLFALWIWLASAQRCSKREALSPTLTKARKSTLAPLMLMLKLTAKKNRGLFSSKTKHTTTRQKLNRSVVRQPASAVQSVTRFQAEHMFIRQ